MPRPYASAVIDAPVDQVWSFVRDFGNLDEWLPAVATCEIEGGRSADAVGCVRRLSLQDGSVVRERLLVLDDPDHAYTYEFLESAFPVRSYRSTLRLAPVTDSGRTFAEWWAWYDAEAKDEETMTKTFADGVYATGLKELQKRFGGA